MNTATNLLRRSSLEITVRKAALIAFCAIAPVAAMADPNAAATPLTRTVSVSIADLDLSTAEGVRTARDRLHETARRLCSQVADSQDVSHQANFVSCVDETLASAVQKLTSPVHAAVEPPRKIVPAADATAMKSQHALPATESRATVSLADLDLSTAEGKAMARERLHEAARRVCSQVADSQDISHQPNFIACVDETMAASIQQLGSSELAAIDQSQTARHAAP